MTKIANIVKPGDIILFRASGRTLTLPEKVIAWGQHVLNRAPTKHGYYHCALVDEDTEYLIEGKFPRLRRARVDWSEHPNAEVWRVKKATRKQAKSALRAAKKHLGQWYNFPLFFFGIFSFSKAEVCSTLIRDSWAGEGYKFQNSIQYGKSQKLITPDEIAANDELIYRVA